MNEKTEETMPEDLPATSDSEAEDFVPPGRMNTERDLFDRVWEKVTRTGPEALRGGMLVRRRRISFTVDGASCAPGIFCDENGDYYDFKLTMQTLTSAEEMSALTGMSDAGQVPNLLCKAALYAVNDKPITDVNKRDFLWEALGPQGRQLASLAFNSIGSASGAALGKYQASITVA